MVWGCGGFGTGSCRLGLGYWQVSIGMGMAVVGRRRRRHWGGGSLTWSTTAHCKVTGTTHSWGVLRSGDGLRGWLLVGGDVLLYQPAARCRIGHWPWRGCVETGALGHAPSTAALTSGAVRVGVAVQGSDLAGLVLQVAAVVLGQELADLGVELEKCKEVRFSQVQPSYWLLSPVLYFQSYVKWKIWHSVEWMPKILAGFTVWQATICIPIQKTADMALSYVVWDLYAEKALINT